MKTKTTLLTFFTILLLLLNFEGLKSQEQIAVIQEPFVILIDPADGTIVDNSFIDMTAQSQATPKGIIQVGDEIWISDQIEDKIFRYDLDGVFVSEIATGLDNIKGMAVINDTEVWVTNAGSNNGAPGDAIIRFDTAGTNLGFFPTTGSSFDIIDTGTEVYISYIGTTTRIERRDYAGTVLDNIVEESVVTFIQQIEINEANNSVYAAVFSSSGANTSGLYEFSIADGSILNYYNEGALRGVAILDDGNVLISSGNTISLLNTTTNTSSIISSGGASHYFSRVSLTPCVTPPTPTGDAAQTFDEGATLADIVVNPTTVTWYATEMDALNNTNPLDNTTLLVDGTTYYAVNFDGGCPSEPFAVTVTVNCIPAATPTGDATQTFDVGATLADVVVTPTVVIWYATEADALSMSNPLPLTTLLENGENYFAVNDMNDCPSEPFEVTIIIEALGVNDFNSAKLAIYPNPMTTNVTVSCKTEIQHIIITNVLGQVVLTKQLNSNQVVLDVSGLSNGLYLLTANASGKQITAKIVKE